MEMVEVGLKIRDDRDTIFQLDRFHIYQEIKRKIKDKDAEKRIVELIDERRWMKC